MSTQKIFILGATGHLGGCVLARLLKHPEVSNFQITTLVRSEEKGKKLKTLGVHFIVGSYTAEDLSFLTDAAAQADFVFAIADADYSPAALAVLQGLKARYDKTGKASILIHTSGTGILADNANGLAGLEAYSDMDLEKLNAIPESAPHRNVDISLIEADKAGYVKTYLILPGTIFGPPSGPLVDLGIQNTSTALLRYIVKPAVSRKQGAYFGKGLNLWSGVFVEDNADLFIILFDTIRKTPEKAGHGSEGYYFAESFVFSFTEVAQTISEVLVEFGVANSEGPTPYSQDEVNTIYGSFGNLFASNCCGKGDRSRALGWKPTRTHADLIANIRDEVEEFLTKSI